MHLSLVPYDGQGPCHPPPEGEGLQEVEGVTCPALRGELEKVRGELAELKRMLDEGERELATQRRPLDRVATTQGRVRARLVQLQGRVERWEEENR